MDTAETNTYPLPIAFEQWHVHHLLTGIGSDPGMELFTYGQQEILSAADINTPLKIANAILVETGCMSKGKA